jgi:predicted HTH transcriptional regulator
MNLVVTFTDADLIAKLRPTEDSLVERKSKSDEGGWLRKEGGWLRTVVAFANSAPVNYPAVLFLGVSNSGDIAPDLKVEDLMKSFTACIANRTWPPVVNFPENVDA